MITETQAANVMWGKTARACDACMSRRARRYWAADEAFLCQICDASVHSANQLASRHERIRLRSSSSSTRLPRIEKADQKFEISGEGEEEREPAWCGGFIRKARTPRGTYANKQKKDGNNLFLMDFNSSNSLVPEIGVEEGLFSPADENEANLNCQVPVFDPFPDMDTVKNEPFSNNDYAEFIPYESAIDEKEQDDDLQGIIPMDLDLAEFALDVESLLGDDSCLRVKDGSPDLEPSKEMPIKIVKDEEREVKDGEILGLKFGFGSRPMDEEDKLDNIMPNRKLVNGKKNNARLLRLDYEAVITAWHSQGSPWTTGSRPEVLPDDCWPGCLFEGYMCPKHEETVAIRSVSDVVRRNGGIGGEREARVSRYREKRRTRLFAKKIRYEVRKLNAEKRPRIKGRFVKRTSLFQ